MNNGDSHQTTEKQMKEAREIVETLFAMGPGLTMNDRYRYMAECFAKQRERYAKIAETMADWSEVADSSTGYAIAKRIRNNDYDHALTKSEMSSKSEKTRWAREAEWARPHSGEMLTYLRALLDDPNHVGVRRCASALIKQIKEDTERAVD